MRKRWIYVKTNREHSFNSQEKKLKKYQKEKDIYDKVINHIRQCNTIVELEKHPISKMYGYEVLRGDLSGYSSFNLCKNRGRIRLIITLDNENEEVCLLYISTDHYEDFKKFLKR